MKQPILLILFSGWMAASAQTLTAAADRNAILIGEPFHVKVEGQFPKGHESWFAVDTLPHFEVMERSAIDTQSNYYGTLLSQTFTLTSWDSGRWALPSFSVGNARSAQVRITVSFSSPFDSSQAYHDMRDIIPVQKPAGPQWYWYLVFLVVLAGLFLLFFPKEKKKPKTDFVADADAYKNALHQLDALEAAPPTDQKELYTKLIDIFRVYLHRRRNIYSYSKTTDDLAVQMGALKLDPGTNTGLLQTLRLGDLVKFARFAPGAGENSQSIGRVRQAISQIERSDAV